MGIHDYEYITSYVLDSTDFENLQSYDVADLLKQYFRELPESLLTSKLSETFISIFTSNCYVYFCLRSGFVLN